ncbi:MAG: hypothetical protein ACKVOP_14180 [Sphingomonadaceae bacterium]
MTIWLLFAPASVNAAWHTANSANFNVYGDTDPEKLRKFVEDLERFDALLRLLMRPVDAANPNKLTIFVVDDLNISDDTKARIADTVAGYYRGTIMGSLAVVPRTIGSGDKTDLNARTVLFHEYAHHFMLQHFPVAYPTWYVEGFAEMYSTTTFRKDGAAIVGSAAGHRTYELRMQAAFPLERMFSTELGKTSDSEFTSFYARSWLLTHYLSFGPTRKGQLNDYLNAFAQGEAPEDAARRVFGDIKSLEREVDNYLTRNRFPMKIISFANVSIPQVDVVRMAPAESAMMPLYMHYVQGSNSKDEVAKFAVAARKAIARFPGNAMALELLAESELDAEHFDAADAANSALLALRPTDARAMLRTARIAAARQYAGSFPGGWPAVRKLVVKANRAAPNDPFPLSEYFRTFIENKEAPTKIAIDGMWRAIELAPQVDDLRFALAESLAVSGDRKDIRTALAPLLNDPHSAETRDRARALLEPRAAATRGDGAGKSETKAK